MAEAAVVAQTLLPVEAVRMAVAVACRVLVVVEQYE
jgi:hypothetical protein